MYDNKNKEIKLFTKKWNYYKIIENVTHFNDTITCNQMKF